jgi:signal transduction histidine kinase
MTAVIAIAAVQTAPEFHGEEQVTSIFLRFALWVVEAPVQLLVLSFVFELGMRRRFGPTRSLIASLIASVVIGVLFAILFVLLCEGLLGVALDEEGPLPLVLAAGFGGAMGLVIAGIWALACVSPHADEQAQRRALETEQLRLEAERLRISAELAQLRSQLEPHFLLNTLNAIAGLVVQDPREARRLIGCLGDLLRDAAQGHDEMQSLEREVTWLRRYAQILESRHGDALRFEWDIPPDVRGVRLPRLLLQPLVENAVQHGALCRAGGGRVAVRAVLRGAGDSTKLVCTVTDNGPGLSANAPRPGALGLTTVRRRLELRCPGSALHISSSCEGTSAVVEVPLTEAGVA